MIILVVELVMIVLPVEDGNDTFNVNDGIDTITDLSDGDILKITSW